jgi:predicted TIM-barrel fold metal-dependent hydrolase
MFGSGLSPTDWATDIDAALQAIESAVFLTPEQKEDIFYNNAARFLRLKNRDSLREEKR